MTTVYTRDAIDDMCDWLDTLSHSQLEDLCSEVNTLFDKASKELNAHNGAQNGHVNVDDRKTQA